MLVHICEEHGDVVDVWREILPPKAHLVVFDQHLDYKPINQVFLQDISARWSRGMSTASLQAPAPFFDCWAFHYGLDNFLKVVIDQGLISRLTWVYAPATGCAKAPAGLLRDAVDALSWIPFEGGAFLSSLSSGREGLATSLGGVPLRICTFEQFKLYPPDEPVHVDVDLDYFVQANGRRLVQLWKPVASLIKRLPSCTGALTVTRSVASGYLPQRYAGLADRLVAYVQGTPVTIGARPAWSDLPEWTAIVSGRPVGRRELDRLVASDLPDYVPSMFEGPRRSLQAALAARAHLLPMAEELCAVAELYGATAPFARLHVASCHLREGRYDEALRALSPLLDGFFDSVHLRARMLAAAAYLAQRDVERALLVARDLVTLVPMRPEGYVLGMQAFDLGDRPGLAQECRQAIVATRRLRILNGRTIYWARHLRQVSGNLLEKEAVNWTCRGEVLLRH
jgi:tetratricopeptide (TPR) repeat protein